MKFKVMYGIKPNMFGKLGGHMTLIGDNNSTPYSIDWFLDKVIDLSNLGSEDDEAINVRKKYLLENILKIKTGIVVRITDKQDKIVALIERFDENTTLQDFIAEEYGF